MTSPNPLKSPSMESRAFLWLLVAVSVAFGLIIWPFNGAICWAIFIGIVFMPVQRRLVQKFGGRQNLAAAATLGLIIVLVILPLVFLTASIAQEGSALYEKVKSGEINVGGYFSQMVGALPGWAHELLERFGLTNLGELQQKIATSVAQSGQAITSRVFAIGQNTLDFLVSFFIMLYLLFFLLRDGPRLAGDIVTAVPLNAAYKKRLFDKFVTVVRATVKGNILVAIIQGALGGIAFAVIGLSGAVLWGTVMAFLSLLPAVGAALVWGPVALYLLATGSLVPAIGLTLWGVLVIGLVDNLLRPILVGKDTKMPDYLVLISTVGGIAVFGINGFVIGPVIAAMFIAVWDIFAGAKAEPKAPPPEPERVSPPPSA
ncbi:MAG: AI-2E family transporter [Burkholderiaceae bacterium]